RQERSAITPSAPQAPAAGLEGTGVRLEVAFHQGAEDVVRVEYRLPNTGAADLAVFDRGDRHAVMTGRMKTGEVGQPLFRDEGEGDYTFGHEIGRAHV